VDLPTFSANTVVELLFIDDHTYSRDRIERFSEQLQMNLFVKRLLVIKDSDKIFSRRYTRIKVRIL
jgi:hypothetical protein